MTISIGSPKLLHEDAHLLKLGVTAPFMFRGKILQSIWNFNRPACNQHRFTIQTN